MSAILYNLTVTDNRGNVLYETTHTSPFMLASELSEIKKEAEKKIQENSRKELVNNSEVL